MTSTQTTFETPYKPGGCLALAIGSVKGRLLNKGSDNFGRWVHMRLRRQGGPLLTIICTYQVIDKEPSQCGPTTYAQQLHSGYIRDNRTNPEKLRRHHCDDLINFVNKCQAAGEKIIVAGDFNEVLGLDTTGLTKLCAECKLVDPILQKHFPSSFATHNRGSTVIDYVLVDPDLVPVITSCRYQPFNAHIISNHRGLFLDIDTLKCFGD